MQNPFSTTFSKMPENTYISTIEPQEMLARAMAGDMEEIDSEYILELGHKMGSDFLEKQVWHQIDRILEK